MPLDCSIRIDIRIFRMSSLALGRGKALLEYKVGAPAVIAIVVRHDALGDTRSFLGAWIGKNATVLWEDGRINSKRIVLTPRARAGAAAAGVVSAGGMAGLSSTGINVRDTGVWNDWNNFTNCLPSSQPV
jgi:hypothetical protein